MPLPSQCGLRAPERLTDGAHGPIWSQGGREEFKVLYGPETRRERSASSETRSYSLVSLSKTRLTCDACQRPPLAVFTPACSRFSAISLSDAPVLRSGTTIPARRLARSSALAISTLFRFKVLSRSPPSRVPRRLASASAAFVLAEINSLSCSASAA